MKETEQKICYSIRAMEDRDIPQVLDIDREAFPTQWPYPTYSSFKQELRNRLAHYIVAFKPDFEPEVQSNQIESRRDHRTLLDRFRNIFNYSPSSFESELIPPSRDLLTGMGGFWLMAGEVHIITIAVKTAFRQMGIGEALLIAMVDKSIELNADVVTLEVRVSNTTAQQLYKKYGFNTAGVRRKYYTDNSEDALIMTTDKIHLPSFENQFDFLKREHAKRWGQICN